MLVGMCGWDVDLVLLDGGFVFFCFLKGWKGNFYWLVFLVKDWYDSFMDGLFFFWLVDELIFWNELLVNVKLIVKFRMWIIGNWMKYVLWLCCLIFGFGFELFLFDEWYVEVFWIILFWFCFLEFSLCNSF